MPFTGFDPYEPGGPIDASGGGLDPSAYYALSPGGRFPGDLANFLEYLASRGNGETANPDFKVPEWARNLPSWLGRLARGHEWNVQNNGPGTVADPIGGPAYNFWSGPGARYGPVGGPLHGLADQGTDRLLDGPDEPAVPRGEEGGRRGGGGGSYDGPKGLPTYGGLNFQPQFLDWQPNSTGATRFVPGSGSSFRPAAPIAKPKGGKAPRGVAVPPTNGGGGAGRGGRLKPPPATSASPTANPPSPSDPFFNWVQSLLGSGDLGRLGGQGPNLGASLRDRYTGIDVGNLGRGTPGWRRDPTTGVHDTSGMPLPTPRTPNAGESTASYMDYLHGLGFGVEDLFGMLGDRGFDNDGSGNWSWRGWGVGPVVRGPNGYQFARQAVPRGEGGGDRGTTGLELDSVWRQALLR